MTQDLQQEERTDSTENTDSTEFDFFFNHDEGRLFLEIYTGTTHYMLELDENELTALRDRLDRAPIPIEERD
jgi:hypothetical protein